MSELVAGAPKLDVLAVPRQVDRLLTTVRDEHHRAILRNYRRHVLLELAGRWPEILTPAMTVPHPVYRSVMGGQTTVYDGIDEVASFYRGLAAAGMTVSGPIEERIAVADWGLATETRSLQILPGHVLAAQGFPIVDRDDTYRFTVLLAMIWPYDEHARLIGEHVYVDFPRCALRRATRPTSSPRNVPRNWSRRCSNRPHETPARSRLVTFPGRTWMWLPYTAAPAAPSRPDQRWWVPVRAIPS